MQSNHQRALKERGIDKLLDDAREDNKENDATLMGRKKCKIPPTTRILFLVLTCFLI